MKLVRRSITACVACALMFFCFAAPAAYAQAGPGDRDGDGVSDASDVCPMEGSKTAAGETVPVEANGCQPFVFQLNISPKWAMKNLVKSKFMGHVICGRGPRAYYFAACTVKATIDLDKAATKKLGLKSPTVATVERTSKSGSRDEVGFLHGYTNIPIGMSRSQRRKLTKLDKITFTTKLTVTQLETGETTAYTRKTVWK